MKIAYFYNNYKKMDNNNNSKKDSNNNLANNNENKADIKANDGIEKIQKEVKISKEIFGASGSEDINKNLGVFSSKPQNGNLATTPNTNLNKEEKINFQRFENTTRRKKKTYSNNKFLESFAVILRNKKGF